MTRGDWGLLTTILRQSFALRNASRLNAMQRESMRDDVRKCLRALRYNRANGFGAQ
jgi:hypothetical protein